MKKTILSILACACLISCAFAQDDLLKIMDGSQDAKKATPVYATFKSTRIINLQSNETMKAKHLDFRIQHRFTALDFSKSNDYGFYNLLGLDGAVIRLGFEYGLTNRVMIGAGRSSLNKAYDGFVKAQLLQQKTKGEGTFPISVAYFGSAVINTVEFADKTRNNLFSSRLAYTHQLILARKFNDHISLSLSPTLVHHNLVPNSSTPNDIYAMGVGASFRITRSTRFNIEYIPRLNGRDVPKDASGKAMYHDAVAVGFDIETGGHVFQLHFTNAQGLIEPQFITENTNKIAFNQLRFGFNLSRTFSFDRSN